jgi:two-component system chemotaxis response regulator CheB
MTSPSPIRVLVVDDSAFMRYTIAKHLEADPGITVVGTAHDGLEALTKIPALRPDVVTLDVEMPRMDGLTALRRIMLECPTPVIMLSSLTQRGTRTTIQALMRGAVDFVAKPTASSDMQTVVQDLVSKVKTAAGAPATLIPDEEARPEPEVPPTGRDRSAPVGLAPFRNGDALVIIGSSTGGPRALQEVLPRLPADIPAAVLVVQHMPAGFTAPLAQRLNESSQISVQEAADGDRIARGLALLAPGDFHLRFLDNKQVTLDKGPRVNHVRPSVDVTMQSAVEFHGSSIVGVVLTGMGADGAQGARLIKGVGGKVIAQDEATCVVYGMPRSVAEADAADEVVPLPEVAAMIVEMVK